MPGFGRHGVGVDVDLLEQSPAGHPAPPDGRVHHLEQRPVAAPDQHEVGEALGEADDQQGRQRRGLGQEQVVHGEENLLGREAELPGDGLEDVDRRPVNFGLTGLARAGRS